MLFNFIPKEFNFFDLFEKQIDCAVEAAVHFKDVVSKGVVDDEALRKIKDLEHKGDDAAHLIIDRLDKSFITPFDREDIHALAKELDDIVDMINTIINRLKVYKVTGVDKHLVEFAVIIEESVRAVAVAVKWMRI